MLHPSGPHKETRGTSGKPTTENGQQKATALAMPHIKEVRKEEWNSESPPFDQYDGLRIKHDGKGGYDCLINVDNTFLLTELARAKNDDKPLVKRWFKYGLVLAAVGMIKHNTRVAVTVGAASGAGDRYPDDADGDDLEAVSHHCSGLAQVIVPIIRALGRSLVV